MTRELQQPSHVELFDVRRIRFIESPGLRLSTEDTLAMDRVWQRDVRANLNLFDGPTVLCMSMIEDAPGSLILTWARSTYRYRALRQVPGAPAVSSVFVCVAQPADDGRLLVGRMSPGTAAPERWQLPGGCMEPPPCGEPLSVAALRSHAARELVEETGVDTPPEDLALWLVTRGAHGNIGFVFRAPKHPTEVLHQRFAALVSSETALEREPELEKIALICNEFELAELDGSQVDYLEPVFRRHAGRSADSNSP